MKDSHYTPPELSGYLINLIRRENPQSVADFCIGGGELLRAATERWPNIKCYGTDISTKCISNIKKNNPSWNIGKCDFLNIKSRSKSSPLKHKFDLILLNPPFTCRGASIVNITLDNNHFRVSTAMAFLVEAVKYLKDDGALYAILPQSVAYSNKDQKIREFLMGKYGFTIIEERNNQEFERCTPNIVLISINVRQVCDTTFDNKKLNLNIQNVEIIRGNVSMHLVKEASEHYNYLIHSTNLRDNKIVDLKHKIHRSRSEIKGPALLIHRVGQPNKKKLCVISHNEVYSLSDCVIAIKTLTTEDSYHIMESIVNSWTDFSNLYKGTGAKYVTIERLLVFFDIKNNS